jgi:CRISPR-associated protein Cas1
MKPPKRYVPISLAAEIAYCPKNFYYRYIAGVRYGDERMLRGEIQDEKRKDRKTRTLDDATQHRQVMVASDALGIIGCIDVVEEGNVTIPVEYKTGPVSDRLSDKVQLCLQALALEEAVGASVPYGFIYFSEDKRRVRVDMTDTLKTQAREAMKRAAEIVDSGAVPEGVNDERCDGCSLRPICLPEETEVWKGRSPTLRMKAQSGPTNCLYVDENYAYLRLKKGQISVTKESKVLASVPLRQIDQVVLMGNITLSTPLVRACLKRDIDIVYLTRSGYYEGRFQSENYRNVMLRSAQWKVQRDEDLSNRLARGFVEGKLRNMRTNLLRHKRSKGIEDLEACINLLQAAINSVQGCHTYHEILGHEGSGTRAYFHGLSLCLGSDMGFDFERRTRRPPRDPVNAMLSFGYALLISQVESAVNIVGLDPGCGFLHRERYGKPALALDIAEEFRPIIVDSVVVGLVNRGVVDESNFEERFGGVYLNESGRKKFIRAFENRKREEVIHPVFKYPTPYRRVVELQIRLLAKVLLGEVNSYIPFTTK